MKVKSPKSFLMALFCRVELSTSWSMWLQIIPAGPTFGKRSLTHSGNVLAMGVP